MAELVRMQEESPPSLTSIAREVDPAIERAILRCLAHDPRQRPGSAKGLALALPRGDPLAAAIAAGETPSPELVANSEQTEGLSPRAAAAVYAAVIAGIVAVVLLSQSASLFSRTPSEYSPEALAAIARDHAHRFGYPQRPGDSAMGLEGDGDYLSYTRAHPNAQRFATLLSAGRPAPIIFWYRQAPGLLDPGAEQSWTTMERPASDQTGMYRIRLDLQGRVLFFDAVPREVDSDSPWTGSVDWQPLFAAAALDPSRFQPAAPRWTPATACDLRAAWTGVWPEAPDIPIRVEAAAWRGKAVSFRIVQPWTKSGRDIVPPTNWGGLLWMIVIWVVLFPAASFFAWRNLQANRGDRAGAVRFGALLLLIGVPGDFLLYSHTSGFAEAVRLRNQFAADFFFSTGAAVVYLAIEPYVRRRDPRLLISWTRLLKGQWRDPLLAANILAGLAAGLFISAVDTAAILLKLRIGVAPNLFDMPPLLSARQFFSQTILEAPTGAAYWTLILVFEFFLLRLLLRRGVLAAAGVVLLYTALDWGTYPLIDAPNTLLFAIVVVFVILRFGIPAGAACLLANYRPWGVLTLDTSRWYFPYSLLWILFVLALATVAFRFSLGSRKLLREETLGSHRLLL